MTREEAVARARRAKRVARLEDMAGKALTRLEQIPGNAVLPGDVVGLIMEAQLLLMAALRDETQK